MRRASSGPSPSIVHLVELGAVAGERLERGLGATACGATAGVEVDAGGRAIALASCMAPEQISEPQRRAWSPGWGAVAVSSSSDPRDWAWVGVALRVLVGMVATLVLGFRRHR
ncbi:hypothetical protein [Sorangium sp. So ce1000]|uniref:hypothetical protein n=1 Tax=Sorangium sp. So ce1000 TaxID=3133325 RepID=UPI003F6225F6